MSTLTRNPQATRAKILDAAFAEFYHHGFQGGSLNRIAEEAGATKGALFHHFDGKIALGYAVVDEVLRSGVEERWLKPMRGSTDPIGTLKTMLNTLGRQTADDESMLCHGCPVANLAQEMSPLDEGFQKRIARIYEDWRAVIADRFENGIKHGTVRKEISPEGVAALLVATFAGMAGTVKTAQSPELFRQIRGALFAYFDSLKP
jgi:TetR/AcrR family transcriptional repressor of nem operon